MSIEDFMHHLLKEDLFKVLELPKFLGSLPKHLKFEEGGENENTSFFQARLITFEVQKTSRPLEEAYHIDELRFSI